MSMGYSLEGLFINWATQIEVAQCCCIIYAWLMSFCSVDDGCRYEALEQAAVFGFSFRR